MNTRTYNRLVLPYLDTRHLEQVFDIPSIKVLPSITKRINVYLRPTDELGLLYIHLDYSEKATIDDQRWQLMDVCKDVEGVIYSFLQDSWSLTIEIDFRERWPYWGPKLKLMGLENDRYKLEPLIRQFNCDIRAEWSPALGFDKTLLMLLSRILEQINYV